MTDQVFGHGAAGSFADDHLVYAPGCSNTTKAHENGHKELGHKTGIMSAGKLISNELDAEAYAFQSMDRKITSRIGIPAAQMLVQDYQYDPHKATVLVAQGLISKGIPFTDDDYKFYRSRLG